MKYIILFIFLSVIFSQQTIETREIIIYKKSNEEVIDLSDYLDFSDTNYILSLSDIDSFIDNNPKKTLLEQCELKIVISLFNERATQPKKVLINTDNKGIEASLCNGLFASKRNLRIDDKNSKIKITSSFQKDYTCEFVFWLTGKFDKPNNGGNIDNHGYLREWHDKENLYIEYKFNNGKKNGEQRRWYVNGQQEILYNYDNGKLSGLQLKWYENGLLKSRMNYLSDYQHGKSEEWYSNGQIKYVKLFDNGVLVNILESYDVNGNIN